MGYTKKQKNIKLFFLIFVFFVFFFVSVEQESLGWGPVLASLQVPELTAEDFLSESQSGGSFLTLYAFILQRLNTEYTAANERRILALINTWTNQVFPRFEPPSTSFWSNINEYTA